LLEKNDSQKHIAAFLGLIEHWAMCG